MSSIQMTLSCIPNAMSARLIQPQSLGTSFHWQHQLEGCIIKQRQYLRGLHANSQRPLLAVKPRLVLCKLAPHPEIDGKIVLIDPHPASKALEAFDMKRLTCSCAGSQQPGRNLDSSPTEAPVQ